MLRRFLVLLAVAVSQPSLAFNVTFTSIQGYQAPLDPDGTGLSNRWFPINNEGIVALNFRGLRSFNAGFWLTDGRSYTVLPAVDGQVAQIRSDDINDAQVILYQGSLGSGYYELLSVGTNTRVLGPYAGIGAIDTNTAGQGVMYLDGSILRLNGDGTSTPLVIARNLSGPRPRILENGDIYVDVIDGGVRQIWRFRNSATRDAVVFTVPNSTTQLQRWDVNESGDLVVALSENLEHRIVRVPAGGVPTMVGGSLNGGRYEAVFINSSGLVSAVRLSEIGTGSTVVFELSYSSQGKPLMPVLKSGDVINNATVTEIAAASDMNEMGQLVLTLGISVPSLGQRSLIIRADPPGATAANPVIPDACIGTPGWCFDLGGIRLTPGRGIFFDPEVAIGYEYVATSNLFAGVEIPFVYGDGRFDLYLWNEAARQYIDSNQDVIVGEYFDFTRVGLTNGTPRFLLGGIEVSAGVDPADPRGFVSGLTFADSTANVRFSMLPIVQNTNPVQWPFTGFLDPVDNVPIVNTVKAGQTVPLKFALGGDRGLDIFAPTYPTSKEVSCSSLSGATDTLEETVNAGASGLQYDASTDEYTYVWKTSGTWSNSCRVVMLRLNDGSLHEAHFRFR